MPPRRRQRPDCLIIGAAKAGTTSLYNILAEHPEVAAASEKEAKFFSHDERFSKGLDWYAERYFKEAPARAVRMEASPAYLTWSDKVAPRIRGSYADGHVRLVAILRDPVARAYSHYWHRVRLGHESLSFVDALAREEDRLRANWDELSRTGNGKYGYVRASCYAARLRPFLERFDRSRFLFLLQEDLQPGRFPVAIKQLLEFLEIDDTLPMRPARLNVPTSARHEGLAQVYGRLKRTPAKKVYTALVPRQVRQMLLHLVFAPARYPTLDIDIDRELRIRLSEDVARCQEMIGRDLRHWLPT